MPLKSTFLSLLYIFLNISAVNAGDNLLPAPPNCATAKIGNTVYVKGEIYISSHQDTLALKEFGFRNFFFVGRAFRSVKYFALWPVDTDVKALPETVTGLNYDRPPDEMVLENLDKSVKDPEVRIFLFDVPTAWSAWPNVSDIRGSGVDNYGWYEGGAMNSSLRRYRTFSTGPAWSWPVGGSCGGGGGGRGLRGGTNLRPDDFPILQGYQNGRMYRR